MRDIQDVLLVQICPICKESHFYGLEVHRVRWLGSNSLPTRPLPITRFFTCPKDEVDFQISVYLMQPTNTQYQKIKTIGLLTEPIDIDTNKLNTEFYDENGTKDYFKKLGISESNILVPPGDMVYGNLNIIGVFK